MNDRIILAEALDLFDFSDMRIRAPDDWTDDDVCKMCSFDPFTSADDCDSLIQFLRTEYRIEIDLPHHDTTDCSVRFIWAHGRSKYWTGDDWKQGVCELALKVIKND